MSGPGGFSEEEELVMGGEYEGAKEERAKIVAHLRKHAGDYADNLPVSAAGQREFVRLIANFIERNAHAGAEVPQVESASAAVVRELTELREYAQNEPIAWRHQMVDEIDRRIAAVRGSLEQPQCTGTLVHSEYTPCPVHDHK